MQRRGHRRSNLHIFFGDARTSCPLAPASLTGWYCKVGPGGYIAKARWAARFGVENDSRPCRGKPCSSSNTTTFQGRLRREEPGGSDRPTAPSSITACDPQARCLRLICDRGWHGPESQLPTQGVIGWTVYQTSSWQPRVGILPRFARDVRRGRQRYAQLQERSPSCPRGPQPREI